MNGWLIPAYSMPKNIEDMVVARVVVKHGFSKDLAEELIDDMKRHLEHFETQGGPLPPTKPTKSFHHSQIFAVDGFWWAVLFRLLGSLINF